MKDPIESLENELAQQADEMGFYINDLELALASYHNGKVLSRHQKLAKEIFERRKTHVPYVWTE